MAALDFPSNPTNGQTYALNGVTYYYNSSMGAWLTQLTSMNIASSSNTQVLFNDAGIANGSSGLVFDKVANTVTVNALNTVGSLGVGTNNPLIKLDVNGGMRVQSLSNPASGSGMELGYDSTQGVIQAFTNRATLATAPIYFTGGQIKFPATQNASSDANTLDDYEEGGWTPSFTFGSGSVSSTTIVAAKYVKIGKMVTVNFRVTFTGASSAANITISGLPFSIYDAITDSSGVIREYNLTGLFWGLTFGSSTSIGMQRYDNNNTIPNGTPGFSGTFTYLTST